MPRKNSTAWAVGNPVTSARLNQFNSDIDDLYSTGSDRLKVYRLPGDPPLQVRIGAGTYRVGTAEGIYAGGTITVTTSSTTRVMIDSSGTIQTSTGGWNEGYTRLAEIVSDASLITSIDIWRNDAVGGVLGGFGFDDTQDTATIPNDYNDKRFKGQFKKLSAIDLDGIANGTYARLLGGRGWTDSSGGDTFEIAFTDDGMYHRSGASTSWNSWRKIGYHNNLEFDTYGTMTDSQSVYLPNGGVLDATYSFRSYTSNNLILHVWISDDNTNWTELMQKEMNYNMGYGERYVSASNIVAFIPKLKYAKVTSETTSYNPAQNISGKILIYPFTA